MGDTIGKIFVTGLAVMLLIIYPMLRMFEQKDFTTQQWVYNETTKLVDAVRNTGYITPYMYNEYAHHLNATGNIYTIEMEHKHRRYDPIYDNPRDINTFHNAFNIHFTSYYTDEIMEKMFPSIGGSSHTYYMSEGDYFQIKVVNKNKTVATKTKELLLGKTLPKEVIYTQYGGMVKNEAN